GEGAGVVGGERCAAVAGNCRSLRDRDDDLGAPGGGRQRGVRGRRFPVARAGPAASAAVTAVAARAAAVVAAAAASCAAVGGRAGAALARAGDRRRGAALAER